MSSYFSLLTLLLFLGIPSVKAQDIPFISHIIDPSMAGDFKDAGDIDGDGFADLIIGGRPGENLKWYQYPSWTVTEIAVPTREFSTDGAVGDVDGDGDLDIVVPDGPDGNNLIWFENPLPSGDPLSGSAWTRHVVGTLGDWGKDVELADFDGNGLLDVATRTHSEAYLFYQTSADTWSWVTFSDISLGNEGLASGDIDLDGDTDLVTRGTWMQNPGGQDALDSTNWTSYTIGYASNTFKALVIDLNRDGIVDVLFSSSEATADVKWWTPTTGDPTGPWTDHIIVSSLNRCHTLQAADMDLDNDLDIVLAQLHTSSEKEIMVLSNTDGHATSWEKQVVAETGLHNGVVVDIGNDGDFDIFGANYTRNKPVRLFENTLVTDESANDEWSYIEVTHSHHRTFGLAFGDMNQDGEEDIVSGGAWYRNPGGEMTGTWDQTPLPNRMHAILTVDVDGDILPDVITQRDEGDIAIYWVEAANVPATSWNTLKLGTIPRASHPTGAQGYQTAQLIPGDEEEIVLSSGDGIYFFIAPTYPTLETWQRIHVSSNPSDEGFSVGDIDGDGLLDIAGTTGSSKRVEWYRNPGDKSSEWETHNVGDFMEAAYPDRCTVADVNGDGKLDIIVSEENGGADGAETFWWEQPEDPTSENWPRKLLVSQASTNSLDAADIDGDGDADIVTGEHRGEERVILWINAGQGNFAPVRVDEGKESHLGTRLHDLDLDGDLDIISIAWDDNDFIHLWRNDSANEIAVNQPPVASGTASVISGELPLTVDFDAMGSYDHDGSIVDYSWSFGDGSTGSGRTVTYTFHEAGTFPVKLTVTDNDGTSSSAIVENISVVSPRTSTGRTTDGLLVLYSFQEQTGDVITDVSGIEPRLDLFIDDNNNIAWLPSGGLSVTQNTIIASRAAASKIVEAVKDSEEITIEAWIKTTDLEQDGPARIVTLSADTHGGDFMLGQGRWGSYPTDVFDVRLRTITTSASGTPSMTTPDGSVQETIQHVVYTRDNSGQAYIYIDSEKQAETIVEGSLSNWDETYRFGLANELSGDRPWLGEYYLVAVYNRALHQEEVISSFTAGFTGFQTTSITLEQRTDFTEGFTLDQNYPNPFQSTTEISYSLQTGQYVRVEVFDLIGRSLAVLVDRQQPQGRYSVRFEGSNLPSGTYLYLIQTEQQQRSKMMTLIR